MNERRQSGLLCHTCDKWTRNNLPVCQRICRHGFPRGSGVVSGCGLRFSRVGSRYRPKPESLRRAPSPAARPARPTVAEALPISPGIAAATVDLALVFVAAGSGGVCVVVRVDFESELGRDASDNCLPSESSVGFLSWGCNYEPY